MFYTYVYFDLRFPGQYCYENIDMCFLYKPMYVGKGQGSRYLYHCKFKTNKMLTNKLKTLLNEGFDIMKCVDKIKYFTQEEDSYTYESHLIKNIGTHKNKSGPLCNIHIHNISTNEPTYTTEYIKQFVMEQYDGLYTCENLVYKGSLEKFKITCKVHGDFETRLSMVRNKNACKKCTDESRTINGDEFNSKLEKIAPNTFDHNKTQHITIKYVKLYCKVHNIYNTCSKYDLLRGTICGCKECGKENVNYLKRSKKKECNSINLLLYFTEKYPMFKNIIMSDKKVQFEYNNKQYEYTKVTLKKWCKPFITPIVQRRWDVFIAYMNNRDNKVITELESFINTSNNIIKYVAACGHIHEANRYDLHNGTGKVCPKCSLLLRSGPAS